MGLKILKYRDGKTRPTWWARYSSKGKRHDVDLRVEIAGSIPRDKNGNISLTIPGDKEFERSRRLAQKALERLIGVRAESTDAIRETIYKNRTGESIEGLPLASLYKKWCGMKRQRPLSHDWQDAIKVWFDRFAAFAGSYARKHNTICETINDVTPEIAGAWFESIKGEFAWETVRKMMAMMRGAFAHWATNGKANPFAEIIMKGGGVGSNKKISRKPLTETELDRLFEISKGDEFIHHLIVAAACTGMRIGDVCTLKWADVDLKSGLIKVTTQKTGSTAMIPIFDAFAAILKEINTTPGDGSKPNPYVFPKAAQMYIPRPKLNDKGKQIKGDDGKIVMTDSRDAIYKAALPYFAQAIAEPNTAIAELDDQSGDHPELIDVIDAAGFADKKRARMLDVYDRIKAGEKSTQIAAALGVPKSIISMDLRDAERLTGENLRPRAKLSATRRTRLDLIDRTRAQRTDADGKRVCKRAASIYGWHSLRHTFVVLALNAGVPVETVRKIVGHGEAETTIENYFNPTAEHEADRIRAQMAGSVIGGRKLSPGRKAIAKASTAVAPKPSIDDFVANMTEQQRKALAAKLLGF